jgi:hypothetical protein
MLSHSTISKTGQEFDYTYEFQWKNDPADETYFDAINLFNYGQVGRVQYSITIPWQPRTPSVESWGLTQEVVKFPEGCEVVEPVSDSFQYRFSIERPKQLLYIIKLPKPQQ